MRVLISPEAESDLVGIGEFIGQDNPQRAESFVAELANVCLRLEKMALRWPFILGQKRHRLQKATYRGYAVVYRVTGDTAEVLRVVHTSMDLPTIFAKLRLKTKRRL